MSWINETDERRIEILGQASESIGLIKQAIEKDWWVTQCLRVLFGIPESDHLIFKGGTSLSKGWGLIERFSEDIDLSISRDYLGFGGDVISNSQIKKLRKASFNFVSDRLASAMQIGLEKLEIPRDLFQISVPVSQDSDVDPQTIFVDFRSLLGSFAYLKPQVKIEIGARAMMEPTEARPLQSMIGSGFPDTRFADPVFMATTVLPKRTFLEKIFLLHETLQANPEKIGNRLARHLYDIERLMDTSHGLEALQDQALFQALASFRSRFNTIKHVDYDKHTFAEIAFVPQIPHRKPWENDYRDLQESMIYGDKLAFHALMDRLEDLQNRFRASTESANASEPSLN